jgi:hypothetical protein
MHAISSFSFQPAGNNMRSGVLQAVLLSEIAVFSEQLGFSAVESGSSCLLWT